MAERYANRGDFDQELGHRRIVVGAPATVCERLADFLARSGANYVLGCFSFGSLTLEQILRSVDLFAAEVMPAFGGSRAVAVS
jgi:hypothetical protein